MRTVQDCLKDGFAALLKGDTKERDRQCAQAQHIMNQQVRVKENGPSPVDLMQGPDGIYAPKPKS
jgi:hypothetical protein